MLRGQAARQRGHKGRQQAYLIAEGGVHQEVRLGLEHLDELVLTGAHAAPHAQGLFDAVAAELAVPHHAAGKADVPRGQHPLAPVAVFLPQAGVNFVGAAGGQRRGELRVQGMDALDDAHPAGHRQGDLFLLAGLGDEVELRQKGLAGGQDVLQAPVYLLHVQGGDVLIVLAAVRQAGVFVQIFIKIVQADHLGRAAPHPQRRRQLVGCGGLAGGGGPGEHDDGAAAGQHLAGRRVDAALVLHFAVAHEACGALGCGVDEAYLNETFGDPDSGHRIRSLLPCAGGWCQIR